MAATAPRGWNVGPSRMHGKRIDRVAVNAAVKDSAHWQQCKIYEDKTFHI
jgi:hypothetical protein